MGYTTDFVGHIGVTPALNEAEADYLTAFRSSRRWRRPAGPYAVLLDEEEPAPTGATRHDYHLPPDGQPGLWCDWTPCWDGCCLAYDGSERFAGVGTWLRYLVEHFLGKDAHASRSGDPRFAGFTFDHVLDGMVVGCRRDNKQLFAVVAERNRVREEILRAGDRRLRDYGPLPYEREADERRAASPEVARREAQVLPFTRPWTA